MTFHKAKDREERMEYDHIRDRNNQTILWLIQHARDAAVKAIKDEPPDNGPQDDDPITFALEDPWFGIKAITPPEDVQRQMRPSVSR